MDIIFRLTLCLFASAGVVQVIGWLLCWLRRPDRIRPGYHVVVLHSDPAELEAQLRYELLSLRWSLPRRGEILFLLDTGLGEEAHRICGLLLRGIGGVFVCTPEELLGLIAQIDNLQVRRDEL